MAQAHKRSLVHFFVLAAGLLMQPVSADQDIDVEYAQQMPLVTESMFLDITRLDDVLVAVGERGHVVTSVDGENWVQAEHVPTRSTLTTVFATEGRLWAGGHDAVIITSGDHGKTWTRQFFDTERQQAVMDILFTDETNGLAIGSYGLILRTHDGGQSWEDDVVDPENDFHLNGMVRFDDGRRMIAGEAGYSYRSFDDGETWEAMELPYQGSMWGALKTDSECVLFYGLRGHVLESCDFGSSWAEIDTGSLASVSGAAMYDGLVLLACNSGTVLIREGGGEFRIDHHSSGVDFAAVISVRDGDFLLVGEDGIHRYPDTVEQGDAND
jgi:photosystem II stability/assembly factor-like uncharacterized protein